jgi:lipopolysaccharide/colanic/teichoic acid biosynthesis glycosyltransferase
VIEQTTLDPTPLGLRVAASRWKYHGPWRVGKRGLDLLVLMVVLPFALLLAALIAVAMKVTDRGPVLFKQERVGKDGRRFRMMKFRTMVIDAEARLRADPELFSQYVANDHKLPAELDLRLTPFGRFLRRTSLDELPQLWNVLTGAMSVVGPRPVTPEQLKDWEPRTGAYLAMRPGLTGLWQINGRSGVKADDRVGYDEMYLEQWSFFLDVKILMLTPLAVIAARGAH